MSNTPEQLQNNGEFGVEAAEKAGERLEQLENKHERSVENNVESAEKQAERARIEALESAVAVEKGGAEKKKPSDPTPTRRTKISHGEQNTEFKRRMSSIRGSMSPGSKAFSSVIHTPVIEKTSEVVGATIARPNAILAGAISAFLLSTAVYLIAKNIGYSLSGFETIGAFIGGWAIGMLYDYLRMMIIGRS